MAGGPGGATSGSRPSANRRMTIARPSASPFSSRPTSVQTGLMNDAAAPGNAGKTCVPAKYGRTYDSGLSASICVPAQNPQLVSTCDQTPRLDPLMQSHDLQTMPFAAHNTPKIVLQPPEVESF